MQDTVSFPFRWPAFGVGLDMRFFIQTMGCKINQYESQALREAWLASGMEEAPELSGAQLILVHTCAVTAKAVADSRNVVRRAGHAAPEAMLLVSGCAAQTEPDGFRTLPGVQAVIGQAERAGLRFWPEAAPQCGPASGLAWGIRASAPDAYDAVHAGPAPSARHGWPELSISRSQRARPILKIQDGCSHGCTYCIVPRARGAARSRPFAHILDEARRLLSAGHRELVLSGINLGQFILDKPSGDFWDMLATLDATLAPEWSGRARLRLSSLDPGMLTPKALRVLGRSALVCPHLHISLQSADQGVLAAMGRNHYTPGAVTAFLDDLKAVWPLYALGVDLLTGFPGETAEAFATTLDFCAATPLTYAHVFPFSRRPGTVAAKAKGQLPGSVKKERAANLRQMVEAREAAFARRLAGLPLLTVAPDRWASRARAGLPPLTGVCEYYTECALHGLSLDPGLSLLPVRPLSARSGTLIVEVV